jgi:hypothetical protein
LLKLLDGTHYDAKLTPQEKRVIRLWIESGAPYAGTYAALGTGMIGAYREDILDRSDTNWPAVQAAQLVLVKRCGTCHTGARRLPTSPSDDLGMPPWQSNFSDSRTRFSRHILYNLTQPEQSLLLLAPLARAAGGYGVCGGNGKAAMGVFATTQDPDYRILFESVLATKRFLDQIRRFDMPGFFPGPEYVRELKRFGILTRSSGDATPMDVYATDQAYWKSHWYRLSDP